MKRWVTIAAAVVLVAVAAGCPAGAKRLTLDKPADQTLSPGGTNEVRIVINRVNFDEPVKVRLAGLPVGVEAREKEIVLGAESQTASFTLVAAATAREVKDHPVTVLAQAPEAWGVAQASETFTVTVK